MQNIYDKNRSLRRSKHFFNNDIQQCSPCFNDFKISTAIGHRNKKSEIFKEKETENHQVKIRRDSQLRIRIKRTRNSLRRQIQNKQRLLNKKMRKKSRDSFSVLLFRVRLGSTFLTQLATFLYYSVSFFFLVVSPVCSNPCYPWYLSACLLQFRHPWTMSDVWISSV